METTYYTEEAPGAVVDPSDGFRPEVVLGPPGTGKTHALMGLLAEELRAGTPIGSVAVVTFTRAARREVQDRLRRDFGIGSKDAEWVRTVHSTAAHLLGVPRTGWVRERNTREFARRHDYRFGYRTDVPPEARLDDPMWERTPNTMDDEVRSCYDWARNALVPLDKAPLRYPSARTVQPLALKLYVERYEAYKAEKGLLDFADCLSRGLTAARVADARPPVEVALVDECQDLGAAAVALVEEWFRPCRRVVIVGDEDQAIMTFTGGNPSWLLGLARLRQPRVLGQSHRVPVSVQRVAGRIITRNRERIPKRWRARAGDRGEVRRMPMEEAAKLAVERANAGENCALLFRNRQFMPRYLEPLLASRVPFVAEGRGASSPYSAGGGDVVRAVGIAQAISDGEPVSGRDMALLLGWVRTETGVLPLGAKAWGRSVADSDDPIPHLDMPSLGFGDLIHRIREVGPVRVLTRGLDAGTIEYLDGLRVRYGKLPEPRITATTCHGSKGREFDFVAVLPDMTRRTWDGYQGDGREDENRVFYVACTRARRTLVLCHAETERSFEWPTQVETGERPDAEAATEEVIR